MCVLVCKFIKHGCSRMLINLIFNSMFNMAFVTCFLMNKVLIIEISLKFSFIFLFFHNLFTQQMNFNWEQFLHLVKWFQNHLEFNKKNTSLHYVMGKFIWITLSDYIHNIFENEGKIEENEGNILWMTIELNQWKLLIHIISQTDK